MIDIIIFSVCLIGLIIATITDIKTREVPDWLNFSLIASGIGLNLIFSLQLKDPRFIINSLAGFTGFFIIAWVMFYSGQWGGGDSKILMGLGALIGLDLSFRKTMLLDFLINSLVAGAAYGLLWSFGLTIKKWKLVIKELKKTSSDEKVVATKKLLFFIVIILIGAALINKNITLKFVLTGLALLTLSTFYLWIYIKAIEKSAMLKYVAPDKLTEGDWIAKDVVIKGKHICGPKDLGISNNQIAELISLYKKKKVNRILIKEGIPFVPSFLIAFILTLIMGNILLYFLV